MKSYLYLVTDPDGKIDTQASFLSNDRDETLKKFTGAKEGIINVIDLSMARPMKRADFNVKHSTGKGALADMSEKELRLEAEERKIEQWDNKTLGHGDLVHLIQQHDLLESSRARDAAVAGQSTEEAPGATFEEKTVSELRDFAAANDVDLPAKATKAEIIEALEAANIQP